MLWGVLFLSMMILSVLGVIYLLTRFHRFGIIQKLSEKHKVMSWIVSALPICAVMLLTVINIFAAIVALLHLMLFWAIFDIGAFAVRKITQKPRKRNIEGILAIACTAVYLIFGWYFAHHVYETDYTLSTDKDLPAGTLRIVGIADLHIGITLDGDEFAQELEKVQKTDPDIVVIAGDFVDDDSIRSDMIKACEALGRLETTYGVYFTFGNHDKGYYESGRDFTADELRAELKKNGVTILEDESVLIDDSFYIIGRLDKSYQGRADIQALTEKLDRSKLMIVLDHQPNDYTNEAAAGVDLVFSGHTHGGHIFPAGYVGLLIKANDFVYGKQTLGDTDFIVTSGISGWAIPFKTGCISEFVVIDIDSNKTS